VSDAGYAEWGGYERTIDHCRGLSRRAARNHCDHSLHLQALPIRPAGL